MITLNSGFSNAVSTNEKITEEEKNLIKEFIRIKGVTILQPGVAMSSESCRATNDLITKKRREFRKSQRGKTSFNYTESVDKE